MDGKTLAAAQFRRLAADYLEAAKADGNYHTGLGARAGKLVVACYRRGWLDPPGLGALVEWLDTPGTRLEGMSAGFAPTASNLFMMVCGNHLIPCELRPDGRAEPVGPHYGGLLPSEHPDLLPGGPVHANDWRDARRHAVIVCEALAVEVERAPADHVPRYLGKGRVRIGDETLDLPDNQATVIEALLDHGALQLGQMRAKTGIENAHKVVKRIQEAFPLLEPYVKRPLGAGKGGYRVTIVDGRPRGHKTPTP